ncbi:MAG TPA: hypothetical protein VFL85_02870 [Candidatus Saccharimonadales bacterium]|nr:hypothetical protein [Candidatus Saccharimonadales bacterium]
MPPDETDEERQEKLPGDENTPFGPADSDKGHFERPETDSNIDSTELYQEGVDGAAGIEEPNKADTVTGYKGESGDVTPDTTHEEETPDDTI